ncbi:MAG: F0F1 ATP synthase subunit B [Chloroflexaceae bacterium]
MEALGINFNLFLAQVINFGVVVGALFYLLYKPVLKMLRDRTERIEQSLQESDQVQEQLDNARRDYDAEIARARQEAATILSQAQERARSQEAEIVSQARQDADRIRIEAREQAEQERDQMLREVKDQVAGLVTLTAGRVLQAELAAQGHDRLINESLEALGRQ